jgi:hypothetical protein
MRCSVGLAALLLTQPAIGATAPAKPPEPRAASATPADPAALAVARQIVAVVHTDQTMDRMMIQFAPVFGTTVVNAMLADPASASVANKIIATGTGGRAKLEAIFSQEFMVAVRKRYPDLEEQVAHEYASLFSADELKQILAFYSSGVGAKALRLMPEIQTKMSLAGQALGKDAGKEAGQRGFERAQKEMIGTPTEPKT